MSLFYIQNSHFGLLFPIVLKNSCYCMNQPHHFRWGVFTPKQDWSQENHAVELQLTTIFMQDYSTACLLYSLIGHLSMKWHRKVKMSSWSIHLVKGKKSLNRTVVRDLGWICVSFVIYFWFMLPKKVSVRDWRNLSEWVTPLTLRHISYITSVTCHVSLNVVFSTHVTFSLT